MQTAKNSATPAAWPPRLTPDQASAFSGGLSPEQLRRLRRERAVVFYRLGHRSVAYDRDSLANWLLARRVECLKAST